MVGIYQQWRRALTVSGDGIYGNEQDTAEGGEETKAATLFAATQRPQMKHVDRGDVTWSRTPHDISSTAIDKIRCSFNPGLRVRGRSLNTTCVFSLLFFYLLHLRCPIFASLGATRHPGSLYNNLVSPTSGPFPANRSDRRPHWQRRSTPLRLTSNTRRSSCTGSGKHPKVWR